MAEISVEKLGTIVGQLLTVTPGQALACASGSARALVESWHPISINAAVNCQRVIQRLMRMSH